MTVPPIHPHLIGDIDARGPATRLPAPIEPETRKVDVRTLGRLLLAQEGWMLVSAALWLVAGAVWTFADVPAWLLWTAIVTTTATVLLEGR